MKRTLLSIAFICCYALSYAQIISPNGDNFLYYNGGADVTLRYLPRGAGGRAMVHDDGNVLTLNYGGDFNGGTRIGQGFMIYNSGKMLVSRALNTSDYTNIAQHQAQIRVVNALGVYGTRALEIALLDNGTGVIQANEANVGYNHLALNPVSGNVGIGTTSPTEKLSVNGKIRAKEIKIEAENWPDYVFKPDYHPMTLPQIEAFIKANGHLPEVPSATEVEKHGVALGETNKILLKKIEELTLLLIDKHKQLTDQQETIKKQENLLETIQMRLETLEQKSN